MLQRSLWNFPEQLFYGAPVGAATGHDLLKKLFLKMLQYSRENTCDGASF